LCVTQSHTGFPQRFVVTNASLCCIRATTPLSLHLRGVVVRCSGSCRWPSAQLGPAALGTWESPHCCVLNDMGRILNPSTPQLIIRSRYTRFSSG